MRRALVCAAVTFALGCAARSHAADSRTYLDGNALRLLVTNHGSFAYDSSSANGGLEYPACSRRTVAYAAGLWIGGRVNGETRVAVAEYEDEYAPGTAASSAPDADRRIYRIVRGDSTSADYRSWHNGAARAQGAPLDARGVPLLLGDVTLWCAYTDADPARHTAHAGSSAPLGVDVDQLAWAYARPGALDRAVFLRFRVTNTSAHRIDSAVVAVWCDPDIGGGLDDFVGFDAARGMGYAYNATNDDVAYGASPPALGIDVLQSPLGEDGAPLGVTAFTKYIGGTDPAGARASDWLMRGRDGVTGRLGHDPVSGADTPVWLTGDPLTRTGWIDSIETDRRMLLACGPFTLESGGGSRSLTIALVVGHGADRLDSVADLRRVDDDVQSVFDGSLAPPPATAASGAAIAVFSAVPRAYDALDVCVSLPRSGAPRLALYDLAGRERVAHVLDAMTAGQHRARLPLPGHLPAGAYMLRMSIGGASAARRVVVL